jgi:hypothetical protein
VQHKPTLSDPQRSQRQPRCVGTIEDVGHRNGGMVAANLLDHRAPPATAGKLCGCRCRKQRNRLADAEYSARIRQAMDDDSRIGAKGHRPLITDICLTFKRSPAFSAGGIAAGGRLAMASDTEDPEAAADRLETALERIAQAATRDEMPQDQAALANSEEIAARLDGLIDRLRTALGSKAD